MIFNSPYYWIIANLDFGGCSQKACVIGVSIKLCISSDYNPIGFIHIENIFWYNNPKQSIFLLNFTRVIYIFPVFYNETDMKVFLSNRSIIRKFPLNKNILCCLK